MKVETQTVEVEVGFLPEPGAGVPAFAFAGHSEAFAATSAPVRGQPLYAPLKAAIDCVGAVVLLALLWPIMATIGLAVLLSSRGGAVYAQRRLGKNGRTFRMFKFRTMDADAEASTGPVWASDKDPRVTLLGRMLRRSRLDELPQLINVVRGEMSLVGPRPERPEIAAQLALTFPHFDRRLQVKPGITGLSQVSTGYASCLMTYRRKLALDLEYIERQSFALDLQIAAKTILVVLTGFGSR